MNKVLLPLVLATALPLSALADVTVYGKANVSLQSTDEGGDAITEVVSNASRLGVKGSEDLRYQVRYQNGTLLWISSFLDLLRQHSIAVSRICEVTI